MSSISQHFTDTLTRTVLLEGLKDPGDHSSWGYLVARYRPRLIGLAQRMGLCPAEAEDAAQVIMMEFVRGYSKGAYDRSKGRLRQWLFGIARRQIANCKRRRASEQSPGCNSRTGFFDRLPAREDRAALGETDAILRCLETVRAEVAPQTMEAFHLFGVLGLPAAQVASELGMTENAVFGAKRRVLARVREILSERETGATQTVNT